MVAIHSSNVYAQNLDDDGNLVQNIPSEPDLTWTDTPVKIKTAKWGNVNESADLSNILVGYTVTITSEYVNSGNIPLQDFCVNAKVTNLDTGQIHKDYTCVPRQSVVEVGRKIPWGVQVPYDEIGRYRVTYTLDSSNQIHETNENNNKISFVFDVKPDCSLVKINYFDDQNPYGNPPLVAFAIHDPSANQNVNIKETVRVKITSTSGYSQTKTLIENVENAGVFGTHPGIDFYEMLPTGSGTITITYPNICEVKKSINFDEPSPPEPSIDLIFHNATSRFFNFETDEPINHRNIPQKTVVKVITDYSNISDTTAANFCITAQVTNMDTDIKEVFECKYASPVSSGQKIPWEFGYQFSEPGEYVVEHFLDSGDQISESNEDNNYMRWVVKVTPQSSSTNSNETCQRKTHSFSGIATNPITIDGALNDWSMTPQSHVFEIDNTSYHTQFQFLNDDEYFYGMVLVQIPSGSSHANALGLYFAKDLCDSNSATDNIQIANNQYYDRFLSSDPVNTGTWPLDSQHGGSSDGEGIMFNNNQMTVFEFKKPLCSNDISHDFCVSPNDTLLLTFRLTGSSINSTPSTVFVHFDVKPTSYSATPEPTPSGTIDLHPVSDIFAKDITADSTTLTAGNVMRIGQSIKNDGTIPAPAFCYSMKITDSAGNPVPLYNHFTRNTLSSHERCYDDSTSTDIGYGAYHEVDIPETPGTYNVTFVIDNKNQVTESNENNNVVSYTIRVDGGNQIIIDTGCSKYMMSSYSINEPTIDGTGTENEWSDADHIKCEFIHNGQNFSLATYMVNDDDTLYVKMVLSGPQVDNGFLGIGFDMVNNPNVIEDGIGSSMHRGNPSYNDDFWLPGKGAERDVNHGGQFNVVGGQTQTSVKRTLELSHPLCSGDDKDFCLNAGSQIKFDMIYNNNGVKTINENTKMTYIVPSDTGTINPEPVYDSIPEYIYVAPWKVDTEQYYSATIRVFDGQGNFVRDFVPYTNPTHNDYLESAHYLEWGPSGDLFASNGAKSIIRYESGTGAFVEHFNDLSTPGYVHDGVNSNAATDFHFGDDGKLYVKSPSMDVRRYSSTGDFVDYFIDRNGNHGMSSSVMEVGPDGKFYFPSTQSSILPGSVSGILIFDRNGNYEDLIPMQGRHALDAEFGPDGLLYVIEHREGASINVYDVNKKEFVKTLYSSPTNSAIYSFEFSSNGMIVLYDGWRGKLSLIDSQGNFVRTLIDNVYLPNEFGYNLVTSADAYGTGLVLGPEPLDYIPSQSDMDNTAPTPTPAPTPPSTDIISNSVEILHVISTDQQGNPIGSFDKGTLSFIKVIVSGNTNESSLVTVNVFDAEGSTLGVGSIKTTINGENEFVLSFMIPPSASSGTADVFANAFSDWPSQGGVPITLEKTGTVTIN